MGPKMCLCCPQKKISVYERLVCSGIKEVLSSRVSDLSLWFWIHLSIRYFQAAVFQPQVLSLAVTTACSQPNHPQ